MVQIDNANLDKAASILRAFSHPVRLQIIAFIDENKNINVNKIYAALKLEQSITSQHLRILRDNEIVKTSREGKFIIYSLNYNKIANSTQAVNLFLSKNQKGTNGAM
jgi:DNA-binding transcriptional ArsR family regulator